MTSKGAIRVIRLQYFIYFGVLGIFLPYFNLYCFHIGFSGFQIGVISACRSVVLVVFALLWGALSDRYQLRRPIYIGCTLVSAMAWALYLKTTDFGAMVAITVLYGIFFSPIISFLETFTMETLGSAKRCYGQTRVYGSVAFILVVTVMGRLFDHSSLSWLVPAVLVGAILQFAAATQIPAAARQPYTPFLREARFLLQKPVLIFLVCAFLMLVSHGAYYGFFSIHLEKLGYGKTFIGIAWALATVAEIGIMIQSESIFHYFSLQQVLLASFLVAGLRWLILAWAASWWVILFSQLTHAMTYGTFHMASILYIDRLSPQTAKTLGQAVNNAVTYGLGMMVGFFASGWLYEAAGSTLLFGASAGVALCGGILFGLLSPGPAQPSVDLG